MPARPSAAGVVQIVLFQKYGADLDVINRFYQKYSGTPNTLSDSGAHDWAVATTGGWSGHLAAFHSNGLTLEKVTVTDLSSATGGFGEDDTGSVGTASGANTPAGTALVIKQHIERRYRGGHPRQYLCGFPISQLATAQLWDTSFLASIEAAYTAFRAAAAAGCPTGLAPAVDVNVSYFQGFTNHTFPSGRVRPIPNLRGTPVVDIISSFGVNTKAASQRRRNEQSL